MFPFGRDIALQPSILADVAHSDWDASFVGATSEPYAFEIDAGSLERVAWGACNAPPWNADVESAASNRLGGLVAPYMYLWTLLNNTPTYRRYEYWVMRELPAGMAHLHTGDEYRFFEPIFAGDRISLVCRIDSLVEKSGRHGRLAFIESTWTYTNQDDRCVATLVSKAATLYRDEGEPAPTERAIAPDDARAAVLAARPSGLAERSFVVGDGFARVWGPVTMKENIRWMAAVDDYASTHYDPAYAIAHRFPLGEPLLAGPHGGGLMAAAVAEWIGDGGWIDEFDHLQSAGLVVGGSLTVAAVVRAREEGRAGAVLDAWLLDDESHVMHTGTFKVTLPSA
jgi:acyl dehydratase